MKRFSIAQIIGVFLLVIAGGLAVACNSKSAFIDPQVQSVQINQLTLSSVKMPDLGNTFFSIDHRQGLIYNAQPLPRYTELDSVAMTIATDPVNHIVVKVGGVEVPKSAKDSVYLRDHKKGVDIVVTSKDKSMSKTYKLLINVYDHNPLTMNWSQEGAAPTKSAHAPNVHSGIIPASEGWYYFWSDATGGELFFASTSAPTIWNSIAQFPEGVVQVARISNKTFVYETLSGALGLWQNGSFVALSSITNCKLVGSLALSYASTQWTPVVLLKQSSGNGYRFAQLKLNGTSADLVVGEEVPVEFPLSDFAAFYTEVEHRQLLNIVGGKSADGKLQSKVWATTSGLDWLAPHNAEVGSGLPLSLSQGVAAYNKERNLAFFLMVGDETVQTGRIRFFVSQDKGSSWLEQPSFEMLPESVVATTYGRGMALYGDASGQVFFFGGETGTPTGIIWKGIPLHP